jgi:hypothetical protein
VVVVVVVAAVVVVIVEAIVVVGNLRDLQQSRCISALFSVCCFQSVQPKTTTQQIQQTSGAGQACIKLEPAFSSPPSFFDQKFAATDDNKAVA